MVRSLVNRSTTNGTRMRIQNTPKGVFRSLTHLTTSDLISANVV